MAEVSRAKNIVLSASAAQIIFVCRSKRWIVQTTEVWMQQRIESFWIR